MAYKRIIGILTVKEGQLVKSYGFAQWRPAGDISSALSNLDRWAVDEIVVLDISRRPSLDETVLGQIACARISTPLAYGGGIRTKTDIRRLMDLGCDRFVVETLCFSDPRGVEDLANLAGRQALIATLPLRAREGKAEIWRQEGFLDFEACREQLMGLPLSEYMLVSAETEGFWGKFNLELLKQAGGFPASSIICFGGLDGEKAAVCLKDDRCTAVAFGNPNTEEELFIPNLRNGTALAGVSGTLRTTRLR